MDNLTLIRKVFEAHRKVSQNIKLVGDSVNDMEAIFSLQGIYSGLTQSSATAVAERQKKLQQVVSFLDEGLKTHFGFEIKYLPPLLGEWLSRALAIEHQLILNDINQTKILLADINSEGLKQEQLLAYKSQLQQAVSDLGQVIQEHMSNEETVLRMIQKALEEEKTAT